MDNKKIKGEHIVAITKDIFTHDEDGMKFMSGDIDPATVIIGQREMLEGTTSFRQIIPYTVVCCEDKFAAYRRTPKGNEPGLHGNVSIGFGGHLDLADVIFDKKSHIDLDKTIQVGARREIEEELDFANDNKISSVVAFDKKLVSNKNMVDKKHIGLVSIAYVDNVNVRAAEDQLDFMGFFTINELLKMKDMEFWTEKLVELYSLQK